MAGLITISSGEDDLPGELIVEAGLFTCEGEGEGEALVARCRHFAFAVFSADLVWFLNIKSNSSLYSHTWPAFWHLWQAGWTWSH